MNRQEELLTGEGKEMGDGGAEGSSAIGGGGQAAVSPTSDSNGMHVHVFESLQLEVGDLLSIQNLDSINISWCCRLRRRWSVGSLGRGESHNFK